MKIPTEGPFRNAGTHISNIIQRVKGEIDDTLRKDKYFHNYLWYLNF